MGSSDSSNYDQLQELVNALELATLNPTGLAPQVNLLRTRVINSLIALGIGGAGSITSISQGTGITLTPNPIVSTGTVKITDTAITPATYGDATHVGSFTVDQQGRLTAASSIAITGGGIGSVTSLSAGTGITLTPNPITTTGTIAVSGAQNARDTTVCYVKDDFTIGLATNGSIGELRWQATAGTNRNYIAGEANHPGILKQISPSNTAIVLFGGLTTTAGYLFSMNFDSDWIIRLVSPLTGIRCRMGVILNTASTVGDPPTNGIYFEFLKESGDTNWFGVTRASSVETRTNTGVAADGNFHTFRLRRIDASTIGFSIDGGTEVTSTTNIPTGLMMPWWFVVADVGSVEVDCDFFDFLVTGLSR